MTESNKYGLLISFPDQSQSFVHGFEAGMVFNELANEPESFDVTGRAENVELYERIADYYGYDVVKTDAGNDWYRLGFYKSPVQVTSQASHLSLVK